MKIHRLLAGVAMAAALLTSAYADVTINITGATAFRGAAHAAILAGFTSVNYAHTSPAGQLNAANQAIFVGAFQGITGTTTIRTSWSGSVEGIRDVSQGNNVAYLTAAAIVGAGENASAAVGTDPAVAKFTFSDVAQTSSPYLSPSLDGGPVGVVTFVCVANEGAPAGLTNVNAQNYRALFVNGFQPLSLFTGVAADSTKIVYATGRNDGSGTRTTALAETGFGISNPVQQWKVTASTATEITELRLWPVADGANASIVWGNDIPGNGGYSSGGTLRTEMAKTSASVTLRTATNTIISTGQNVVLITWLGTGDAANSVANGAKFLSYNGVAITPTTSGLNAADLAKVTEGQYTAWGYEYLLYSGSLATDQSTFYNYLTGSFTPTNLGASGVALDAMHVGRNQDGGVVAP